MKAIKAAVLFVVLAASVLSSQAQKNPELFSQAALNCADSLLSAYREHNWEKYIDMSYPGVIQYYGGKKGFENFLDRSWMINRNDRINPEQTAMVQIIKEGSDMQCVIKKSSHSSIDGKKAMVISYLIGQSTDGGRTWKYFDVAFTSSQDLIYVMPDISGQLQVPERKIIFQSSEMAMNQ